MLDFPVTIAIVYSDGAVEMMVDTDADDVVGNVNMVRGGSGMGEEYWGPFEFATSLELLLPFLKLSCCYCRCG